MYVACNETDNGRAKSKIEPKKRKKEAPAVRSFFFRTPSTETREGQEKARNAPYSSLTIAALI
jgi:hypothetical protein